MDFINWDEVSKNSKLNEDLIRNFENTVNSSLISRYETFSEPFIMVFKDRIDWNNISVSFGRFDNHECGIYQLGYYF